MFQGKSALQTIPSHLGTKRKIDDDSGWDLTQVFEKASFLSEEVKAKVCGKYNLDKSQINSWFRVRSYRIRIRNRDDGKGIDPERSIKALIDTLKEINTDLNAPLEVLEQTLMTSPFHVYFQQLVESCLNWDSNKMDLDVPTYPDNEEFSYPVSNEFNRY